MRGRTQSAPKRVRLHALAALGALAAGLALSGCGAGNMTGFDFPAFGLLKKSDKEAREARAADLPPAPEKLGPQ